jgi:glucarate dehydratase
MPISRLRKTFAFQRQTFYDSGDLPHPPNPACQEIAMNVSRRNLLASAAALAGGAATLQPALPAAAQETPLSRLTQSRRDLTIKEVRVTPIALPDPPLLASSGCHGPYFLRTIVEIVTADGITGVGETGGSERGVAELKRAAATLAGKSALAYRTLPEPPLNLSNRGYAAVEVACLDAIGKATGLRLCELLGGPVREEPEFASYLFFRYAADNPALLADKRIVDRRGRGEKALDQYGEVRTPEAMAELAWKFHQQYGFRVHKLKAGVLKPDVELAALKAISDRLGAGHLVRIDPNARWSHETAMRIAGGLKSLPLEYYEDPVPGQEQMGRVRRETGLKMSTNMCVTQLAHLPAAVRNQPVDVVLADHHGWGGFAACQALGMLARPMGWTLSQHSNNHAGVSMAAMIHLASLIPELTMASDTHYPWLIDDADILVGGKLKIAGGRMRLRAGPGLGVELDRDKLSRAHETYQKCGMRDRDDATTMRMVEPNWQRTTL